MSITTIKLMIRLLFFLYYPSCFHGFQASLSILIAAWLEPPLFQSFPKSFPPHLEHQPFGHHSTLASVSLLLLMILFPQLELSLTWPQHYVIIVALAVIKCCFNTVLLLLPWHPFAQCYQCPHWGSWSHFQHSLAWASLWWGCRSCPAFLDVRYDWIAARAVSSGVHDLRATGSHLVPGTQLTITWVTFNPDISTSVF